jgi:hypothetical protein
MLDGCVTAEKLLHTLGACEDPMTDELCDRLSLPSGSSYARGAASLQRSRARTSTRFPDGSATIAEPSR